ncbi:MAG: hypothetical protein AB8G05_07305 [Oligoflexales bacterium]
MCYSCANNKGEQKNSKIRGCYLCHCNFCEQHYNNDLAKIANEGGIICDDCFLNIGKIFDEKIDRISQIEKLVVIYENLFTANQSLINQLNNDADLINSHKFKQNIKDTTGDSLGVISSLLLISGRIVLLAVPGCQVISIISLCSMASNITSIAIKEFGSLALDDLQLESLANINLIATLFFIKQTINTQLVSEYHKYKLKDCKKKIDGSDLMKDMYSNPILTGKSDDKEEENVLIKTSKKIFIGAVKSVFGIVGLASHSIDLFKDSKEIFDGEVSELSQLFMKIAEELESLPTPKDLREKIGHFQKSKI